MINTLRKTTAFTGLLFSLNVCAESQIPPPAVVRNEVNMGGQALKLIDAAGRCAILKPDNTHLATELAWPCQFSQDRKGLARVEMFNSVPIVVALHNAPTSAPNISCLQTTQAIRLRDGALETSSLNRHAMCSTGHDQKMFVGMFRW